MNDFYCAAPWRGLHLSVGGQIKTCCAGSNILGNLNNNKIEEVLQGPKIQEIRKSISQGIPHDYCRVCVEKDKLGNSERIWHNTINPEFDPNTALPTDYFPTMLDLRWNTTCNLSCNYCGPMISSKWADIIGVPYKSGTRHYYNQACDFINNYKETVRNVSLVGGEPLLLPENDRLLDVISETCKVSVITNLTTPLDNNKIFKKLSTRTNVDWFVSLENIEERFEYVRHGSTWNTLNENIQKIKTIPGHTLKVLAIYHIYNITRLDEMYDWAASAGLSIAWQPIIQPVELNPYKHNQAVKDLAQEELDKVLSRLDLDETARTFLSQAKESYQTTYPVLLTTGFLNHIDEIENKHHPDQKGQFSKLWPELVKALNT